MGSKEKKCIVIRGKALDKFEAFVSTKNSAYDVDIISEILDVLSTEILLAKKELNLLLDKEDIEIIAKYIDYSNYSPNIPAKSFLKSIIEIYEAEKSESFSDVYSHKNPEKTLKSILDGLTDFQTYSLISLVWEYYNNQFSQSSSVDLE